MKDLTSAQDTARIAGGRNLIRFVSIAWPSGIRYYSERDTTNAGWTPDAGKIFEPVLLSFPRTARSVTLGIENVLPPESATFTILSDPGNANRVDVLLETAVALGVAVTTYQVFKPAAGSPAEVDWHKLGRYVLESYQTDYGPPVSATLTCTSWLTLIADKRIGRAITDALYPNAPTHVYGNIIPHVFGTVDEAPCPLIAAAGTRKTTLDESINESETLIAVANGSVFDTTGGTLAIGAEELTYANGGISGNTITVSERGANSTTAAPHAFGSPVTQLMSSYTFALADHAIQSFSDVRINGVVVPISSFSTAAADASGAYVTTLTGQLPEITENVVTTTQLRLEEFETPPTWAQGAENTATDGDEGWAQAVDAGTSRHVTFCRLPDGAEPESKLHLTQSNDLTGNRGDIKKAVVRLEYQTTGLDAEGWPEVDPYLYVIHGATETDSAIGAAEVGYIEIKDATNFAASGGVFVDEEYITYTGLEADATPPRVTGLTRGVNETVMITHAADTAIYHVVQSESIKQPPTDDTTGTTDLYPEGLPGQNTTKLFEEQTGSLGTSTSWTELFVDGYTSNLYWGHDWKIDSTRSNQITRKTWPGTTGWIEGDAMSYPLTSTSTVGISVWTKYITSDQPSDNTTLEMKLSSPTGTAESVTMIASVTGDCTALWSKQKIVGKIEIGGESFWGWVWAADGEALDITVTAVAADGASWAQAELIAARFKVYSGHESVGNWSQQISAETHGLRQRFILTDVAIKSEGDYAFFGGGTPLDNDAYTSSNRVTQEFDISVDVINTEGWPWFTDDTSFMLTYGAVDNSMNLLVYNLGVFLEVLKGATRRLTESEAEMSCTIVAQAAPHTNYRCLRRILTDSAYYGLTAGTDYENAVLAAACTDAKALLASGTWNMARHINRPVTLRELLASAATDAGIRIAIDSGMLIFFPRLTPSVSENARALTRNDMVDAPASATAHIQLIWNDIAVYYKRDYLDAELRFQGLEEAEDTVSQALSWGERRYTYDAEWIREATVAQGLAKRFAGDFSEGKLTTALTVFAGTQPDWEVGDVSLLTDSLSRLSSTPGRVVGASYSSPSLHRLTFVRPMSISRIRIWEDVGSGSYIDAYPIQDSIDIVVDGALVARLHSSVLRIAGEVDETPWAPEDTESAVIVYSSGFVYFCVYEGDDTSHFRAMAIGSSGDLRVSEVQEDGATYPNSTAGHTFTDRIELADDNSEDLVVSVDLVREYARLVNVQVASQVNGRFQCSEIEEGVTL